MYLAQTSRALKSQSFSLKFAIRKMLPLRFLLMLSCLLLTLLQTEGFILRLIAETLQNNVAGEPITHERTNWNFDPEAAKKARSIYYEKHGYRSEKLIERLGVGLDGQHGLRREAQQLRDTGRLNGEHNINYPAPPV